MKVEDAKKKICPFMSGHAGNAVDIVDCEKLCITGGCMAWVYTNTTIDQGEKREEEIKRLWDRMENYAENLSDIAWKKFPDSELPEDDKEGYCLRLKGME